ncbi:hypothetical protein D9M68_847800 [compost metagenome]
MAPRSECFTPSMASRSPGIVQRLRSMSISPQRAKRSSLERMNTCRVSETARRVRVRPLYAPIRCSSSGRRSRGSAGRCWVLRVAVAPTRSLAGLASRCPCWTA